MDKLFIINSNIPLKKWSVLFTSRIITINITILVSTPIYSRWFYQSTTGKKRCNGKNSSESNSSYIVPLCHYHSCDVELDILKILIEKQLKFWFVHQTIVRLTI